MVVIIIHALDDCGTPDEQKKLVDCMVTLADTVPWIKVSITSMPEPKINSVLSLPRSGCVVSNMVDGSVHLVESHLQPTDKDALKILSELFRTARLFFWLEISESPGLCWRKHIFTSELRIILCGTSHRLRKVNDIDDNLQGIR